VALRYWKRMREQAALHADDPRPATENPWQDGPVATLSQLGARCDIADDDRAARYSDWAARMRDKGAARPGAGDEPATGSGYWSAEALFEDSRRVAHEEGVARRNPWVVRDLLGVFDLAEGATRAEIGHAYRRLAKQHHPDRFMMADPETRAFHEAEMRRVIDAYEALCQVVA
jgi:DnaJ-domain-containing protein 1